MKVRNIVRKAAVLGTSAAMLGATAMGALAYDLADYPADFIADGMFDGKIVVGAQAATADVIGSIDIAASLQAESTTLVPLEGESSKVAFEGDAFELATGSDVIELREPIGDVLDTVTDDNLEGLKSGRISTSEGETGYDQYLRLKDGSNLQNMTVNYVENDDNYIGDYLVVDTDLPFMEWEIQFPEGLESERDSNGRLDDIEDRGFNILGTDFTIVKAEVDAYPGDGGFEITLMGGSIADTLREGETRTYSIDGVDYEVTLVFVSDPNSGSSSPECKFSVNGELTKALEETETETLSGGLQLGVRDILVNSREGVASFFLGADKLVMNDGNVSLSAFANPGDVEINNDAMNDADVEIAAQWVDSNTFEITSIKYRLTMDAEDGTTAFIPAGDGIRQYMKDPESLLSETLDLKYGGLTQVARTDIEIKSKGDDEYRMLFTNIQGNEYDFPLISNDGGTFKWGDDDDEFVFFEAASASAYNIGREDYFVVSNDRGSDSDKSVTNVLRYEDYDNTDKKVEFEEVGTGNRKTVTVDSSGEGDLVIGGHTYSVNVENVSANQPDINVNLDGDTTWGEEVGITAWGGVRLDIWMGANSSEVGDGLSMAGSSVNQELTALAKNFDTVSTDETLNWSISQAASNTITLDFAEGNYDGPLEGGVSNVNEFQFRELEDDDDHEVGMTDWGILIDEYNPDGSDDPNELTLSVPKEQITAQVFVTLGSVSATSGGSGMSERVNPIAVGLAVLDSAAPAVGSENLIVVGGPCANTLAFELMGQPENCAEGFEPGKAVIKAWDKGDTVAILVAGYEAEETQGASRVLAEYGDYSLSGSEVEVVVADLSSITVQAPSEDEPMDDEPMDDEPMDDEPAE